MNEKEEAKIVTLQKLFEIKITEFLTPLENFIQKQTTSSVVLLFTTLLTLLLANSPWKTLTESLANAEIGLTFYRWSFSLSIKEWLGSGFMALFFFLIGLELKREVLAGKLRHPKQISLIIMAAIGGMIFPALIYWGINHGTPGQHGWGIPMATDTAFAVGVLALMARRVSYGISIFLVAMAIFDDIGSIAVISFFYTQKLHIFSLIVSALILVALFFVNVSGIRSGWVYAIFGVSLWSFIFASGLHATLAGLFMAIAAPARTRLGETGFVDEVRILLSIFEKQKLTGTGILGAPGQHSLAIDIEESVMNASTPLQRWETFFINPVGIVVLPLFALLNAGISLTTSEILSAFSSRVMWGVLAGLVLGKPLGVLFLTFIGLRLKIGKLPEGMSVSEVVAVGLLAGIGFTMSLFIAVLSFEQHPDLVDFAKIGILFSSVISAVSASAWIFLTSGKAGKKSNGLCA